MATSGTFNFALEIDDVFEVAIELVGGEQTLGHEPASARRSLNLMLKDWQNRGILLWSTEASAITVTASVSSYALSGSTIDALQVIVNRDNTDLPLTRISYEEYLQIPQKSQTGRATQYSIKRDRDNPTLFIWPIPENSTDVLKVEKIRELEDINKSAGQNADVPKRFLPCLSAGLAFYMSIKRPGVDAGKITFLKQNYEELLERALTEDSERASIFFKPKLRAV